VNLLIDLSGDKERAEKSAMYHGIGAFCLIDRSELKPRALSALLRRMRRMRPDVCYVHCTNAASQFNRFPVEVFATATGANTVCFLDNETIENPSSRNSIYYKRLPLYLLHCLYAVFAAILFSIAYGALWLVVRCTRAPRGPRSLSKQLCYIKTDFWHDLQAGGSVTHTREFINAALKLGYKVQVFSADRLAHYHLGTTVDVIKPAKSLYDFPIWISQMEYNVRFSLRVWWQLKGEQVMGVYQRSSVNNVSGVILSRLLLAPFVLEFNTSSTWSAKNWGHAKGTTLEGLCEALNLAGANWIACVSEVLKAQIKSLTAHGHKVVVNPNGVDPVRFGPEVTEHSVRGMFPPSGRLVGFIGVFGQWHGVLTLMSCVKFVVKDEPDAHFVIVGDGKLRAKMMEILLKDGTEKCVTFVGLVDHDLAPLYLSACDVLVSPHEDMENGSKFFGSPTKIFEYMAAGKGIVASNVGQLAEILEDEHDALLVAQKDERQLAIAIVRLLRDEQLRKRMGAAARQKVLNSYTWEANVRRAARLFMEPAL
jgi:glycosyltransferase involved in cell wall biosynthesis